MDQNQTAPVAPVTPVVQNGGPVKPKGKNKTPVILCSIFGVLAAAGIGFGVYGMFFQPKPSCEPASCNTDCENKTNPDGNKETAVNYILEDYASILDGNGSQTVAFTTKLSEGLTEEFLAKQKEFLDTKTIAEYNVNIESRSNRAGVAIKDDILSAYTAFTYNYLASNGPKVATKYATMNIDLATETGLSNTALLAKLNLSAQDVYAAILTQLANNTTADFFLLNTTGNVDGERIMIEDFKNDIQTYASQLVAGIDGESLYINENGTLHAFYNPVEIIKRLGMSSHMNHGLTEDLQEAAV